MIREPSKRISFSLGKHFLALLEQEQGRMQNKEARFFSLDEVAKVLLEEALEKKPKRKR